MLLRTRRVAAGLAVTITGAGLVGLPSTPAKATATIARPLLELTATADHGEIVRYGHDGWIDFTGLGVGVDAPWRTFEIRARRSYGQPITLELVRRTADGMVTRPLPADLAGDDFSALDDFFLLEVTDRAGNVVMKQHLGFCPNGYESWRVNPNGPTESTFPQMCSGSLWTKGMTFGIDRGWSVPALGGLNGSSELNPIDVPDGDYRFRFWIRSAWRDALRLPTATSRIAMNVTIRTETYTCPPFCEGDGRPAPGLRTTFSNSAHLGPTGRTQFSSIDPNTLPDLRALPAWQMDVANDGGRDYLNFAANVWNAGPQPLVVEGFRRRNAAIMDAHQFFYRNGKVVGSRLVGEMEFHRGGGHDHWHFRDFAKYELTGADKTDIQRSGKEAFCLAPTDAIDLTVRNAEYRPGSTGLGTACGGPTARWIREVLPSGWGDTYGQYLAGQAFDITDLPNGTYFVKVVANPDHRLIERNLDNNTAYRKVILGGEPGARTVVVPPYRGIDTEAGWIHHD